MTRALYLSPVELECAKVAAECVRANGGFLTFDEYDEKIAGCLILAPFNWCQGWGDRATLRRNQEKLAAAAAVMAEMLAQENGGYRYLGAFQPQERVPDPARARRTFIHLMSQLLNQVTDDTLREEMQAALHRAQTAGPPKTEPRGAG